MSKILETQNKVKDNKTNNIGISEENRNAFIKAMKIGYYKEFHKQGLIKVVVLENQTADFYLTYIPFGFRIKYHVKKFNQQHRFNVFIDSCEVID